MLKNKMTMSIVVLVGAVVLFIGATFAWLAVSQYIDVGITTIDIYDVEATVTLEVSTDGGENYSPTSAISIANAVPGDVYYYRLKIENTGSVDIDTHVDFYGFIDSLGSALGNPDNYNNGQSLIDVVLVGMTNTANADTIDDVSIVDLVGTLPDGFTYEQGSFPLAANVDVLVSGIEYVNFTLTISEAAGNDYSNLRLTIAQIQISSVS